MVAVNLTGASTAVVPPPYHQVTQHVRGVSDTQLLDPDPLAILQGVDAECSMSAVAIVVERDRACDAINLNGLHLIEYGLARYRPTLLDKARDGCNQRLRGIIRVDSVAV
jgi:hypothetical protein